MEILTFPAMLEDPLINLMMTSDGVTEHEMRSLMQRMREVIAARGEIVLADCCKEALA